MKLPPSDRPNYPINPIFEAVCQLRFPVILKIKKEDPSDFQEIIRCDYPIYEEFFGVPANLPIQVREIFNQNAEKQHRFISEDKVWQVSVGKDYLSLTNTGQYTNFEEFSARFDKIFNSFNEIYKPTFYSRIGLRYRNLIVPSVFAEIKEINWNELIPAHISPELHDNTIGLSLVSGFEKKISLVDETEKVNMFHQLATISGEFKGVSFENELAYIIDIDSYTEEKHDGANSVKETIKSFKRNIQNIFRYSLSDKLHKALERRPV